MTKLKHQILDPPVQQNFDQLLAAFGSYAPLASPAFTGTPTGPTAAVDTNTTQLATTAYVVGQGYAKLASPTFIGTVTAPILKVTGTGGIDLTSANGTTAATGTSTGDKIALYDIGYGFGIQSSRLVAYVSDTAAKFAVRLSSGTGNRSSGTDVVTLGGDGSIGVTGALAHTGSTLGFFNHAVASRSAAYTLNAGATTRNLASGATTANVEQTLRQLITDLQGYGLLQ